MNSSQIHTFPDFINDPDKRFKEFFEYNCVVKLNSSCSINRYIRSAKELIRMANIYFSEHNYLYAFALYSRYVVLYCETIKLHPQYSVADKDELALISKQVNSIAFPRAEKLKIYIKEIFINEYKDSTNKINENNKLGKTSSGLVPNNEIIQTMDTTFDKFNQQGHYKLIETTNDEKELESNAYKPTNRYNLRKIFIPSNTVVRFLDIAYANTSRNIETCGILAGKLTQNSFILSHCIIPKQKGTSETCSTEHESELCEVIDCNNLITLGWIHTHPT